MQATLEQIFPFAFAFLWFGGTIGLFLWTSATSRAYLSHFEPVDGVPLETYRYIPGELPNVQHASRQALREVQRDPSLESLRQLVWRRVRYTIVWLLGFPLLILGTALVLGMTGYLR